MKQRYECDWCRSSYYKRKDCAEHESQCCEDPAMRSCETCEHHDTVMAGTGKVWNTCAAGLLKSPKWKYNHAKNCPKWHDWRYEDDTPNSD